MPASLNVILSGATLQVVDNTTSTTRVNSSLANPTLGAAVETYIDFMPIGVGGTAITLPAATIWALCIRNLGGINGTPAGNITVRKQVTGGALVAAVDSEVLVPNGVYIFLQPTTGANGIIAVTLVASIANTPVEILMAA